MNTIIFITGVVVWSVIGAFLLWHFVKGLAITIDWFHWSFSTVNAAKKLGEESKNINWKRFPKLFAARLIEFTLDPTAYSYSNAYGNWDGFRNWRVYSIEEIEISKSNSLNPAESTE